MKTTKLSLDINKTLNRKINQVETSPQRTLQRGSRSRWISGTKSGIKSNQC